ncbi:MAG: peptidase T [Ruminococcaceae bacterium]|nr:peptidase T [Oscillospiraceae bacterium]
MKAYERLLKYVKFNTQSSDTSGAHPSTASQFELGKALRDELISLGCEGVLLDDKCYLYAKLPATKGYEGKTKIGFIAHMDTAPDFSGDGVNPTIHENYDGGAIALGESGRILDPKTFPHLKNLRGRTLITTDGTTLLGADDKAGVSEIMTLVENLSKNNTPHGDVLIAFTPDEEIGEGADHFDVSRFGADFAYTVDGGEEGSLEYENFNAASATFTVKGFNVHPGSAKDTMINASLVAMEINSALPSFETPSHTDGYEGFYHLISMKGNVEEATLSYIIRDHDSKTLEVRKETLKLISERINSKYGDGTASLEIKDSYKNMKEMILPHMHLIENAKAAAIACGVSPTVMPIRGGTDGARLSFMGLPCPNLGTGGYAFHGPFEHISVEGMDKVVSILEEIVKAYSE